MKLLTKQLLKSFEKIGRQENTTDPMVVAKFFDPTGSWTWFATEYDPSTKMFFGLVHGIEKEWGLFGLEELENLTLPFGLGIERYIYFDACRASEL
jgi:hypothetical protein